MNTFTLKPVALLAMTAAVLLTGGATLYATRSQAADDAKPAAAKPALTVAVVQPQQVRLPVRLAANGNIAAWQEASVGAEANGLRLTEVRANVGDRVRKGAVLAVFAADTVRADLAQAKASLLEAEAHAAEAAANAERARSLQASGALSASQINQYLTAEQTAKARVEAARALNQVQQARLAQTTVLAPDDGIVSARMATVGAVVGAGTELFRLIRQGRLEWRAEVTSTELGHIKPGTLARVTAASGAVLEGKVRMVGPTVDPQTRAALVYVDLKPAAAKAPSGGSEPRAAGSVGVALPGMYAKGDFTLGDTPALTVPQSALVVRDGFSYVYRVNPDNRVTQLKVQSGRLVGERMEVTSGLPADARVVASGGGFLNDGDLVRIVDSAAKQPSAPVKSMQNATK